MRDYATAAGSTRRDRRPPGTLGRSTPDATGMPDQVFTGRARMANRAMLPQFMRVLSSKDPGACPRTTRSHYLVAACLPGLPGPRPTAWSVFCKPLQLHGGPGQHPVPRSGGNRQRLSGCTGIDRLSRQISSQSPIGPTRETRASCPSRDFQLLGRAGRYQGGIQASSRQRGSGTDVHLRAAPHCTSPVRVAARAISPAA